MLSGHWPAYICTMPLNSTTGRACTLQPSLLRCPLPTTCADYVDRCGLACQYENMNFHESVPA